MSSVRGPKANTRPIPSGPALYGIQQTEQRQRVQAGLDAHHRIDEPVLVDIIDRLRAVEPRPAGDDSMRVFFKSGDSPAAVKPLVADIGPEGDEGRCAGIILHLRPFPLVQLPAGQFHASSQSSPVQMIRAFPFRKTWLNRFPAFS